MTAQEMIHYLETLDPDALVLISRDEEGTEIVQADRFEEGFYKKGELEFVPKEEDDGRGEPSVVLFPYF